VGDEAVIALANSPSLAGLTVLGLADCDLSGAVGALARSPY